MRFFELYHTRSKKMPPLGKPEHWPEAWKVISHKAYPALPKTPLPMLLASGPLAHALETRISDRNFSTNPITFEKLSSLVQSVFGLHKGVDGEVKSEYRRSYPSAGARYPIETYVLAMRVSGLKSGLYHYSAFANELSLISDGREFCRDLFEVGGYEWVTNASAIILLSGVFIRTIEKYGERGYRAVLLEAGHAGQNVHLLAQELGLKCCALALNDETKVNAHLRLDGVTEGVVHTLVLGA